MFNRLKHTLMLNDQDVYEYIVYALNALGYEVHHNEERGYIFGVPKGTCTPVLLLSHIDTMLIKEDHPLVLTEQGGVLINENGCLGGDDRCGVAGILEIAGQYQDKPFVLFTNGEEPGNGAHHWGMAQFINDNLLEQYLSCVFMIIGLDRKGHNEYVTYEYDVSEQAAQWLRECGYTKASGSASDGTDLQSAYHIMYVNVSIGYYQQHTADEFVLLESYVSSLMRVCRFMEKVNYTQQPLRKKYSAYGYPAYTRKNTTVFDVIPKQESQTLETFVAPTCYVCGRDDRDIHYQAGVGEFLCHVCEKKVKASGGVTALNITRAKANLEAERARTRASNRLFNVQKNNIHLPTCPVCGANSSVHWSKAHIGFVCTSCQWRLPDGYNGIFWVKGKEKLYAIGKQVYHVSMDGRRILKIESAYASEDVKVCDCCKNPCMNYTAYVEEGYTVQPAYLCKTCKDELTDDLDVCNIGTEV